MTDIRDEVAAALDSDDFRDRHERAMREHILGAVDLGVEHRCDDLCSDAILSRLLGKHAVNEYPWQPDAARGLTVREGELDVERLARAYTSALMAAESRRTAESQRVFGHPGASIPATAPTWKEVAAEYARLTRQPEGQ